MKKLLSLLLALSTCFAFVACEDEEPSNPPANPPAHTHEYESEWSKDDTHHWYACTGTDCTEVKDKAEHSWNAGVVNGDTKTFTCTTCGKTKTEAVQTDYDVTAEEWATALSFPYDNYKIYSNGGVIVQTTEVYGTTVRKIATSNGQVMVNQLATQVGDKYYSYSLGEYKISKQEIQESVYASNRTMSMCTTFLFDDFTYDTASKTYKADSVGDGQMTYTNVEMAFENGKLVAMSMSYTMGVTINATVTVTYGDVEEIQVPDLDITEAEWNATKAKFEDHSVPKTFIQTQGERVFTLQTDGVTLYTHVYDEAYGTDSHKIYTKDGDNYYRYAKDGNGAWTVTELSKDSYEQNYKSELDIIKNNAMLASYQYIVETDGVYTYEPYGSGSRRYTYYFIDGELTYLESRVVGEFEIAVNYDVPVIEIPEVQETTVTSDVWDDNVIMSGDIVVTIVDDGETITAIANETGLMYGENFYKKEGNTYLKYNNGSFVEVSQSSYQWYENIIRGIFSEFEGEYSLFTYNSDTQAYECATYGTYYTDVVVKFVDGKFVYMSYSYISGGETCTRTVSVSYETRAIEYPSAS